MRLQLVVLTAAILWEAALNFGFTQALAAADTGLQVTALAARRQRAAESDLPQEFVRRTGHRLTIDQFASEHHVVAGTTPKPTRPQMVRKPRNDEFVRVVRPQIPDRVLRHRLAQETPFLPLRGFRAPILVDADALLPAALPEAGLSPSRREAAAIISRRLAHDGLLGTLAAAIHVLEPSSFLTNTLPALMELADLGFPADLLPCFAIDGRGRVRAEEVASHVARQLSEGRSLVALQSSLKSAPFRYLRNGPVFRIASEGGDDEIRLLRMQIGGGYDNGIITGDSIDVTAQLIAALPEVDFLVSVKEEFASQVHRLAQQSWPLRRSNQLTLVVEKLAVTPWAQDSGKAGFITAEAGSTVTSATLVPRYASQEEDGSLFMPGESYLADGLRAAGHSVVQSALLFQGGNLLAVHDPVVNKRILLIGEAEIYRNTALGLTRDQVQESFRSEFAVDLCVVLPVVSHHLDFDVTIRTHEGQVLAFVNDTQAAVRVIAERGLAALESSGRMTQAQAQTSRGYLRESNHLAVVRSVAEALYGHANAGGRFPLALAKAFVADKMDWPVGNFQCFLVAMDFLASVALPKDKIADDEATRDYFIALQELEADRQAQIEQLKKLGWKVVPVPSLPDLYRTINYLNGIHDPKRYLMPAYGGFYESLDQAAARAFTEALDSKVTIVPILTAESQRYHGAVHCMAAAHPRAAKPRK